MAHNRRLLICFTLLFLFSGCPSQPANSAIVIATPTQLATATTMALPATATPAAEEIALPLPTATPVPSETAVALDVVTPIEPAPLITGVDAWAAVDPSGQTVVFWHRHSKFRATILNEIIDDFNASNPQGIWVEAVAYEDYGALSDSMVTVLNTGDAPNLVLGFQSDLADYFLAGGSLDLTPLFASAQWGIAEDDRADFFQWALNAEIAPNLGNARIGMPIDRSADVLFVNQDWLTELGIAALPQTPAEFYATACAAAKNPFTKSITGRGIGFELSDNAATFASWVFAFGGEVYDVQSAQFTLDSEEAIAAWRFVQSLINEGCATIAGERYGDQADFGNGIALFTIGASNSFYFYNKAVEDGAGFQWQVTALPHTGERPILNLSGPSIALLKTTPEAELAAWLFLKHYASPTMQAKWVRANETFPIRNSAFTEMGKFLDDNPNYQSLIAFLPDGRSEPSVPGYGFIRGAISDAITAMASGADVESTLRQLNAEANQVLEEQVGR